MRDAALVVVVLTVAHARSRAHPLHVAGNDRRPVAERILVPERTLQHVADDLHVAVPMGAETGPRLDAILVDDSQRPVAHVLRVVIVREREAVIRLQPAVVRVPAVARAPDLGHAMASLAARSAPGRVALEARLEQEPDAALGLVAPDLGQACGGATAELGVLATYRA